MNHFINSVINWVKAHPLYAVGAVIAVVLLLFAFSNALGGALEHWRASRFDAKQAAYEKQVADLKTERDALIKRANDAEAKAMLKEAEAKELHDLIDAKGGQIEKAANDLEKKLEDAKRDTGNCANAPDQRECLCAKLKALGFECN